MNNILSSSSSYRSVGPSLDGLPDDVFMNIVSFIDKTDNETIASLACASKECWRQVGVEGFRSYFYAAHRAYSTGTTEQKSTILPDLIDWLKKVADQMPVESQYQIWDQLVTMTDIDQLSYQIKLKCINNILKALQPLLDKELNDGSSYGYFELTQRAYAYRTKAHEEMCELINLQSDYIMMSMDSNKF